MDVVLRHVPVLIAQILAAEPLDVGVPRSVLRVDLGPEDTATLYLLHRGVALATYTERLSELPASHRYVETVLQAPDPRPVVCVAQVVNGRPDSVAGPIVIFDGWHRSAAWLTRVRAGDGPPAFR